MVCPPFASFRALHFLALGCTQVEGFGAVELSTEPCFQREHTQAALGHLMAGTSPRKGPVLTAGIVLVSLAYLLVEAVALWVLALALDMASRSMPHVPLERSDAATKHGRSLVIKASAVQKKYLNGFEAVKGVNFEVYEGDCIGLLGPNGAGKTTVCSMVTGLMTPTSGQIKIWNTMQGSNAHGTLGICAQGTVLFDDLTVQEHLKTFAMIKYMDATKADQHVSDTLGKVGLTEKVHSFPHQLSGGMQRKLAICLAVVGNPGLVVLDEPTTGLDPMAREGIWDIVRKSGGKGGCNVVTTHLLEEAEALCTNIVVMSSGKIVAQGSPQELKERYGSGYALTVECDSPEDSHRATQYLRQVLGNPELRPREQHRAGQLEFGVGSDAMAIGALFQAMARGAESAGIKRWGVSQSTLQDAYMAIVNGVVVDGPPGMRFKDE